MGIKHQSAGGSHKLLPKYDSGGQAALVILIELSYINVRLAKKAHCSERELVSCIRF